VDGRTYKRTTDGHFRPKSRPKNKTEQHVEKQLIKSLRVGKMLPTRLSLGPVRKSSPLFDTARPESISLDMPINRTVVWYLHCDSY